MKNLRGHQQNSQSAVSHARSRMLRDLGMNSHSMCTQGGGSLGPDGNENAIRPNRRASRAVKIDRPPSFYEADVKKYMAKFGKAVELRKSQKL